MSLPPPVQSILELFQGPLSNMRFADVDAAGLAQLAAEVEGAAAEVEAREAALVELRQNLAQRYEALLALSHQALAYARVYAENNDEQLLETIGQIMDKKHQREMPRARIARGIVVIPGVLHQCDDDVRLKTGQRAINGAEVQPCRAAERAERGAPGPEARAV